MLTFHKVLSDKDLKETYRLRYQVYCIEKGYEPEEKCPNNCELDEYDAYSIHFLAKENNRAVGTIRLILNNPIGFPAEKYCKSKIANYGLKREQTVEISRFAISSQRVAEMRCDRQKITIGLFQNLYQECKDMSIQYFCAAMGKGLQRLLSRYGIAFIQAGQMVDYHGMRSLHISQIPYIEQCVCESNKDLLREIFVPFLMHEHQIITQSKTL